MNHGLCHLVYLYMVKKSFIYIYIHVHISDLKSAHSNLKTELCWKTAFKFCSLLQYVHFGSTANMAYIKTQKMQCASKLSQSNFQDFQIRILRNHPFSKSKFAESDSPSVPANCGSWSFRWFH